MDLDYNLFIEVAKYLSIDDICRLRYVFSHIRKYTSKKEFWSDITFSRFNLHLPIKCKEDYHFYVKWRHCISMPDKEKYVEVAKDLADKIYLYLQEIERKSQQVEKKYKLRQGCNNLYDALDGIDVKVKTFPGLIIAVVDYFYSKTKRSHILEKMVYYQNEINIRLEVLNKRLKHEKYTRISSNSLKNIVQNFIRGEYDIKAIMQRGTESPARQSRATADII